jgi:hypothetical protein
VLLTLLTHEIGSSMAWPLAVTVAGLGLTAADLGGSDTWPFPLTAALLTAGRASRSRCVPVRIPTVFLLDGARGRVKYQDVWPRPVASVCGQRDFSDCPDGVTCCSRCRWRSGRGRGCRAWMLTLKPWAAPNRTPLGTALSLGTRWAAAAATPCCLPQLSTARRARRSHSGTIAARAGTRRER